MSAGFQTKLLMIGIILFICSGLALLVTWLQKVNAEKLVKTTTTRTQTIANPNPPMPGYNQPRFYTGTYQETTLGVDQSKSGLITRFYNMLPYLVGLMGFGALLIYLSLSAQWRLNKTANAPPPPVVDPLAD